MPDNKIKFLDVRGNLDRQAEAKGDKVYYDLISRGADILSTDRPVDAGKQLQQYREEHHIRLLYPNSKKEAGGKK